MQSENEDNFPVPNYFGRLVDFCYFYATLVDFHPPYLQSIQGSKLCTLLQFQSSASGQHSLQSTNDLLTQLENTKTAFMKIRWTVQELNSLGSTSHIRSHVNCFSHGDLFVAVPRGIVGGVEWHPKAHAETCDGLSHYYIKKPTFMVTISRKTSNSHSRPL